MVKLENISLPSYGPEKLRPGDVFEATHKHAALLIAIGKCRAYREPIEEPANVFLRPRNSEILPAAEISPRTGKPKRQYKRKDMVAE